MTKVQPLSILEDNTELEKLKNLICGEYFLMMVNDEFLFDNELKRQNKEINRFNGWINLLSEVIEYMTESSYMYLIQHHGGSDYEDIKKEDNPFKYDSIKNKLEGHYIPMRAKISNYTDTQNLFECLREYYPIASSKSRDFSFYIRTYIEKLFHDEAFRLAVEKLFGKDDFITCEDENIFEELRNDYINAVCKLDPDFFSHIEYHMLNKIFDSFLESSKSNGRFLISKKDLGNFIKDVSKHVHPENHLRNERNS